MPAANIGPTSGVSGSGLDAIRAGMKKGSSSGGGGGDGFNPFASRGQFKRFMQYQDWTRSQDRVDTTQRVIDEDTMRTRDTARDIAKGKAAGSEERKTMTHSRKQTDLLSQSDFDRAQAARTSERIYEETTKGTAFDREQKGLNAAARRSRKERDQATGRMTEFISQNPGVTELNLNNPKSGDTVKIGQAPKRTRKTSVQADIT